MALDLVDLGRVLVTQETKTWLEIETAMSGESKQTLLRQFLHAHALSEIRKLRRKAKLLEAFSTGNGHNVGSGGDGQ